ncbi:MAG: AAA family ATPase, partial [Pleurocapsa sp. SU_196_0]|nr:AAA family ATPase [Pleurocapsa sp. SU_196_0]
MPRRSFTLKGIPKPLPFEVRRGSLLKRLTNPDLRLVMLTAPAGYGKTTLLGQLARESAATVAWLTCTEDDANPTVLLDSLAASVKRIAPRLRLEAWQDAVTANATPLRLAQRLAEDLNASSGNLWLILDRCERLSADAGRTLDGLISSLGEGHRVFMAGYDIPGAPVSQWLAHGDSLLLQADDLGFSEQETKSYLRLRGSDATASQVRASVGDWPAGTALSAGVGGADVQADALVLEVLERLSSTDRHVLPNAAVLAVWSEAEATRFDLPLTRGWLRRVVQVGLPLTPLGQGRYRPHTILTQVLETEFESFSDRHALHQRIAEDLETRGERIAAVRHFVAGGDRLRAVALTEQTFPKLMRFDQRDVAEALLRSIPTVDRSPRLGVFFGWLHIVRGENQDAADLLRGLYARGVRDGYLWWLLSMTEYVFADFDEQLRLANEGLEFERDPHIRCLSLRVAR